MGPQALVRALTPLLKKYPLWCEATHGFVFLSWSVPSLRFPPGSRGQGGQVIAIYEEGCLSPALRRSGHRTHMTYKHNMQDNWERGRNIKRSLIHSLIHPNLPKFHGVCMGERERESMPSGSGTHGASQSWAGTVLKSTSLAQSEAALGKF